MILPAAKRGEPLCIMQRELEFSFFAMRRTTRRWGVHSMIYAAEPWAVINGSLTDQIAAIADRRTAQSFVRQGREYFTAAERADTIETRPVLYYYSFLNLAKALAIARTRQRVIGKVVHGIVPIGGSGHMPSTAELSFKRSTPKSVSAVDELHVALTGAQVPTTPIPVRELIAQSVVAHRLWREASKRKERFLTAEHVLLRHDPDAKSIWATLCVRADTMKARGRGVAETAREAGLAPLFRAVADPDRDSTYRIFEQVAPVGYNDRPSDKVMDVIRVLSPLLWQTVTSAPPYRRYYLYLSPPGEIRLRQWLSIYAILFWLGSLTRYQPVELLDLLDGSYGPFFRELIATQPSQLLYTLASEFKQQDVAKAAVV